MSFSRFFFDGIEGSKSVLQSFKETDETILLIGGLFPDQLPQMISDQIDPSDLIIGSASGDENFDNIPPKILDFEAPNTVEFGDIAVLKAEVLIASGVASITGAVSVNTRSLSNDLPFQFLQDKGEVRFYESTPILFNVTGTYNITLVVSGQNDKWSQKTVNILVTGKPKKGDLNKDGLFDYQDLWGFSGTWAQSFANGTQYNSFADMDSNGIVDEIDLLLWLNLKN